MNLNGPLDLLGLLVLDNWKPYHLQYLFFQSNVKFIIDCVVLSFNFELSLVYVFNPIGLFYVVLQEKINDDVPMPTYFRFLALLAFKIFVAEKV